MQRNETIINQFAKTIKESPLDVQGDPILLDRIFDELAKKKKRRFFQIFFTLSFVVIGVSFVVWGITMRSEPTGKMQALLVPIELHIPEVQSNTVVDVVDDEVEKMDVVKTKKSKITTTSKKENVDFKNVVSYKFKNHQVDVFENGDEEFIQINVFGADGMEQDVLKIMEDLKKSYKTNEVYVDSVKHK